MAMKRIDLIQTWRNKFR